MMYSNRASSNFTNVNSMAEFTFIKKGGVGKKEERDKEKVGRRR